MRFVSVTLFSFSQQFFDYAGGMFRQARVSPARPDARERFRDRRAPSVQ
jgi:hypothetical protein